MNERSSRLSFVKRFQVVGEAYKLASCRDTRHKHDVVYMYYINHKVSIAIAVRSCTIKTMHAAMHEMHIFTINTWRGNLH